MMLSLPLFPLLCVLSIVCLDQVQYCVVSFYGHHQDLHVLTHSFPARRPSDLSDEAQVVQRPDMDTLVKTDTVAEAVDVMSFQGRAESVPSSVLERFEQDAKPARAAMNDAIRQEGKSRSAHARSKIGRAHV